MSFFGVQLNSQGNKLIFEQRLHLSRNKYAPNIRTIYRSFAQYDPQITGTIEPHHFEHALNQNGLFMKKYDLQVFEKSLGKNAMIDWFQYLRRLKEPMGPLRRQLVQTIFDTMDQQKKGLISVQQLLEHFNPNVIEFYQTGKMGRTAMEEHFLSMLVITDNAVTRDEFIAFYDDTNINYAHNDIFFRFVSNIWHYQLKQQDAVREEAIRTSTKNIRFKLIEKTQGSKDEFIVRKVFDEFDMNKNFYLSSYDLSLMVKKLGLELSPLVIEKIHERTDKNHSGYIQFQEFKKFLYYDPYPF